MLRAIVKNLASRFRRTAALRSTVVQLRAELDAERARRQFERAATEKEISALVREMVQTQADLVHRDLNDMVASPPRPSQMKH